MKRKKILFSTITLLFIFSSVASSFVSNESVEAARPIVFPIIGPASFSNDFDAPRANGPHHATDIFASKRQKVVSPVNGTITHVPYPQPSYGWAVFIEDENGYEYSFIHLNNDRPGTDDGQGGAMNAYAADAKPGNKVVRGQHIGYVGDSGNAENTPSHLHFEIYAPNGSAVNPYNQLLQAQRISTPASYGPVAGEHLPYGTFPGGASIAMGNLDGDVQSEYITGAGPGGGPHVKLYESNSSALSGGFYAYAAGFGGGIDVALGDVDNDNVDEIITGAGPGGGPHVKVFEKDGTQISSFFAYGAAFNGGVRVAAGDIDGDGADEIITGVESKGGPHVKARKLNGTSVSNFMAYAENFYGGTDVAAGDLDNDGTDEIVTGAGPGASSHVRVFAANATPKGSFAAYNTGFTGGVRVSAGNVRTGTPQDEIVTTPVTIGGPNVRMFNMTGSLITQDHFLEEWWRSGRYDVAAGYDTSKASAGVNRRTTVRLGLE